MVGKFEQGDVRANAREVDRGFHARVATAHNGHAFALIERTVAVGAEVNTAAQIGRFAFDVEFAPACARGNHDLFGQEGFAAFDMQLFHLAVEVYFFHLAVDEEVDGIVFDVFAEVLCQFRAGGFGDGDEIFDSHRVVDLSAETFGHDGHVQTFAGGVDGCGTAGGATAHHNEIVGTFNFLGGQLRCAEVLLEFVEQAGEFAATAVHQLVAAEHCGHTLQVKLVHLVLEQRTVHNFLREIGVVEGDEVERLHHIGAVGAGQRDVGGETNRAAEGLNAANEHLIGQVFALAVGVEYGQEQRGELVSAGDTTEHNAGFDTVFEELHFEMPGGFVLFEVEVIGSGGKVRKEGFEFGSMRVGTVGVEGECELRVEFGKN